MTTPDPSEASRLHQSDLEGLDSPTIEMIARVWHALSDEASDGIAYGGADCTCLNYANHARTVLDLFAGHPTPEPDGLGSVVVNPLTDGVWVRAAHPTLPWYDPATASSQQWADPCSEDWFDWDDLPRPLVVQSTGWTPPQSGRVRTSR